MPGGEFCLPFHIITESKSDCDTLLAPGQRLGPNASKPLLQIALRRTEAASAGEPKVRFIFRTHFKNKRGRTFVVLLRSSACSDLNCRKHGGTVLPIVTLKVDLTVGLFGNGCQQDSQ